MSKCDIYLDNYTNCYYSGQQIIGNLQVTFTNEKTVKGIVIKFKGCAETRWSQTESRYNSSTKKNESHTVWYHGSETYFSMEVNLLNNNEEDTVIPAGVHKYPFTFTLPSNLPSTFEGTHGNVTYSVKGVVKRPFLKFDYEAQSPFNLVSLIDLNKEIRLKEPANVKKTKNLCCLCWKNGPISFELGLPCTGFAVGQNMDVYLFIENMSNSSIEEIKIEIKQEIEFTATVPRHNQRHSYSTILKRKLSGVGAHGANTYEEALTIPREFSAPNLISCSIIKIRYHLEVEAYLPCPHKNITGKIPIAIGHIPLTGVNLSQPYAPPLYDTLEQVPAAPPPEAFDVPTAPPAQESLIGWNTNLQPAMPMPMPFGANDSNLPPPSYEQAVMNAKK